MPNQPAPERRITIVRPDDERYHPCGRCGTEVPLSWTLCRDCLRAAKREESEDA